MKTASNSTLANKRGALSRQLNSVSKRKAVMILVSAGVMTASVAMLYVNCLRTPDDRKACLRRFELQNTYLPADAVQRVREEIQKQHNVTTLPQNQRQVYELQHMPFKRLKDIIGVSTRLNESEQKTIAAYQNGDFARINKAFDRHTKNKHNDADVDSVNIVMDINKIILARAATYGFPITTFRGRGGNCARPRVGDEIPVTSLLSTTLDPYLAFSFMTRNNSAVVGKGERRTTDSGVTWFDSDYRNFACFFEITLPARFPVYLMPSRSLTDEYEILLPVFLSNDRRYVLKVTAVTEVKNLQWQQDHIYMEYVRRHNTQDEAQRRYKDDLYAKMYNTSITVVSLKPEQAL